MALALGCSSSGPAPYAKRRPETAHPHPWIITSFDPDAETPALLWNGLIGVRIMSDGAGEGNTLFDISSYQPGGEEKIVPVPNPLNGHWSVNYQDLRPDADYHAQLDMRLGLLFISWAQEVKGERVEFSTAIHVDSKERIIRQVWHIKAPQGTPIWFEQSGIRFSASAARKEGKYSVSPIKVGSLDGTLQFSASDWDPGEITVNEDKFQWQSAAKANEVKAERIIALAPAGQPIPKSDPQKIEIVDRWLATRGLKVTTSLIGPNDGRARGDWEDAKEQSWALGSPAPADIEIDGPVEDQQFIRSALFYLRSAVHPQGTMSVSPMGLSSDIYGGHVFWDADIWVFPALALLDPERAAAIPRYRLEKSDQAYQNFFQWAYTDSRPTAQGEVATPFTGGRPHAGHKFPWESSVTGKETVPGPSKFQDHITGSVAFSINQADALGLIDPKSVRQIAIGSQMFYLLRSEKGSGGLSEIKGTMSPDENHTGDNDLYTNLLAMWCGSGGKWPAQPTYKLPKDDKTFLTYDNDALRGYKQAAAVLSIYPLQYPPAEKQARAMMDRFADKVSKNGPAMSDSIHALIWARLGEKEKAYKAWHDSWKPFVKPPFLLFSEKRSSSRTYFTTGAAGSLQAVLYGFAGLRIDDRPAPGAKWSMPLRGGKVLSIKPNLPKEWKKLTLRNLTVLGKRLNVEIEGSDVRVTTP